MTAESIQTRKDSKGENSSFLLSFINFVLECGEMWGILRNFEPEIHIKYVRMRFLGNIEAKMDTKGRAFLPAIFRKMILSSGEEHMVLRKDVFQDCLVLYPESVWNEQLDLLRSRLNRWNDKHQQIYRTFISDAEEITLDANGRFLISKRLMRLAKIYQDIKFIGMGDTIEIWNNDAANSFMDSEEFGEALQNIMSSEEPIKQ